MTYFRLCSMYSESSEAGAMPFHSHQETSPSPAAPALPARARTSKQLSVE